MHKDAHRFDYGWQDKCIILQLILSTYYTCTYDRYRICPLLKEGEADDVHRRHATWRNLSARTLVRDRQVYWTLSSFAPVSRFLLFAHTEIASHFLETVASVLYPPGALLTWFSQIGCTCSENISIFAQQFFHQRSLAGFYVLNTLFVQSLYVFGYLFDSGWF